MKAALDSRRFPPPPNAGRWPGRLIGLSVPPLVFLYLGWLITRGAGLIVGDEGFWLIQGRETFERLPAVAGSLAPLTDVLSGMWSAATAPMGLFGARLGWALLNTTAATLVYLSLSRHFPPAKTAVATIAALPMICNQQFMTLEYTNIPWFFLLLFALAFVESQRPTVRPAVANAFAVFAGASLAAAVLARLPVLPAVLLPVGGWLIGHRRGRVAPLVLCVVSTAVALVAGLGWLWQAGCLSNVMQVYDATRNLSADGASGAGGFYSTWRLLSVYIQNAVVGTEQFAVLALALVAYMAYRQTLDRVFPWLAAVLGYLPLVAWAMAAALAPKAAPGVFNPRFLSGLPVTVLGVCAIELWRSRRADHSDAVIAVRQLALFGSAIPVLVMAGSNLGFYRMISGSWLAIPLAILLIPDLAAAAGERLASLLPAGSTGASGPAKAFLNTAAAAAFVYSTAHGLVHGFDGTPPTAQTAGMRHPRLRWLRETPTAAASHDGMLAELQSRVAPGEVVLAYPHLEMVYWLTDTTSPLKHMFVHASEESLRSALIESRPRYVVFHDNNRDPLWNYSESRRAMVDDFLATSGYTQAWKNDDFTIFERVGER